MSTASRVTWKSDDSDVTLRTTFPCHPKRHARLLAIGSVPRETYRRRCPTCSFRWKIERTVLPNGMVRMDRLEWSADR